MICYVNDIMIHFTYVLKICIPLDLEWDYESSGPISPY